MKSSDNITLLNADNSHAKLFFKWVNSASSLKNKIDTKNPISKRDHYSWYTERLLDPDTYLWVIQLQNGDMVGQIRFQKSFNDRYDVDVFILPSYRMKGYAISALFKAIKYMKKCKLVARIKDNNQSSKFLFEKAGFIEIQKKNNILVMEKII